MFEWVITFLITCFFVVVVAFVFLKTQKSAWTTLNGEKKGDGLLDEQL